MVRLSTARKEGAHDCWLGLVWGGGSPYCCMSILCSRIWQRCACLISISISISILMSIYLYLYIYIPVSI